MNGSELKAKSELSTKMSEGQATGSMGGLATRRAILIAGPTASGKSALALRLAKQCGGYIINSDSMQVYDVLDQLTARPQPDELQAVAHYLYGYVKPQQHYSTGRWLEDVQTVLQKPELQRRVPVFVGGTGLYFKALLGGLSDMPQIDESVRDTWRRRMAQEGAVALHGELQRLDPLMAARLKSADSQRIVRALEVVESTGRSLLDWQNQKGTALISAELSIKLVITPDRKWLHQRIAKRFAQMMDGQAIDEVQALLQRSPDPALPVMKAIGVREIEAMLQGTMSREEAVEKAVIATRQYAKRQMTWFRNQLDESWQRIEHADDYDVSSILFPIN